MEDNVTLQADELEVLSSIFDCKWKCHPEIENTYSFSVSSEVRMYITIPINYPSESPPAYELLGPSLPLTVKEKIDEEFKHIYEENRGSPVIFQWLDRLQEIINSLNRNCDENNIGNAQNVNKNEIVTTDSSFCEVTVCFQITHGPIVEDRKSVFQGHACSVGSENEVFKFIEVLKKNKKVAQATHNTFAYRIKDSNVLHQDYGDDGETHAGQRLLHLLQIIDVTNVAVVVSRWYGGIHLGPKRFQHINNAARKVLEKAKFIK